MGKKSGISEDLLSCMDEDDARKIDTIAQFWLANQGDRLQRIQKWQLLHPTPFDGLMTKDTYHDLFVRLGLGEHRIQNYFRARAARCHKGDAIAFDSSTISSYSRHIHEVRQSFNKAGDGLDTVKLLSLYDLQTHQPIAFARQPGNLSDVAAIENTLKQLRYLNISKAQIVTDRGYYSQDNMAQMFDKHMKFLTAASIDLRWINKTLQENKPRLETACSLCPWDYKIHGYTVPIRVNFNRIRSCQSQEAVDPTVESHRLYVHLYLNRERVTDDERRLAADLMELKHDIELGRYEQLSETARKKADRAG